MLVETFEFIQKLIDEPEKLRKIAISIGRASLTIIFTSYLYEKLVSHYTLIDPLSYQDWTDFLLSGRILICLFLVFVAYFILFELFGTLTSALLMLITKSKAVELDEDQRGVIHWLFKTIGIINYDRKTRRISAGEHTESFRDILIEFEKKENREQVATLQNSYASQIWHTYILFLIYYLWMQNVFPVHGLLKTLVIAGAIFITVLYLSISAIISYVQKNSKSMVFAFDQLLLDKKVDEKLHDLGIENVQDVGSRRRRKRSFTHMGTEYILSAGHVNKHLPVSEYLIESMNETATTTNKKVVLITNHYLTEHVGEIVEKYRKQILVIPYGNYEELEAGMEEAFKEK